MGFSKERRQTITEKLTDSVATMANSISAVVSPQSTEQKNAGGYYRGIPFENTTPGRKSRLRSEGLKQLMELKELKDSNILTESQFEKQKEKILKDLPQMDKFENEIFKRLERRKFRTLFCSPIVIELQTLKIVFHKLLQVIVLSRVLLLLVSL